MRWPAVAGCTLLALVAAACSGDGGGDGAGSGQPTGSSVTSAPPVASTASERYGPPSPLGTLADPAIRESSGLVASRRNPGVYWTHNDSGGGPVIYCLTATGGSCGKWDVTGAQSRDWEDIAAGPAPSDPSGGAPSGPPHLYVGDIGDNDRQRASVVVYRFAEPRTGGARPGPASTEAATPLRLRYPDGPHDAEALMVHPESGDLYIVTKEPQPAVYKAVAPVDASRTTTLTEVAALTLGGGFGALDRVTGGDIAPDGGRVALCTYLSGYELTLPDGAAAFDAIWNAPRRDVDLGLRPQGEALAYRLDGRALLTTAEAAGSALLQAERR